MIKDSLANASRYGSLSPAFKVAFDFLTSTDLGSLPLGRVDLDEGVFANVQSYVPVASDTKQYEAHFQYADIQVVVEGSELLVETPIDEGTHLPTEEDGDCVLFDQPQHMPSIIALRAGDFCIVWPGEAHKPGITNNLYKDAVAKVVVKVPVK